VTYSSGFPIAGSPPISAYHGSGDAYVVKLNTSGTELVYGTFLGGIGYDDGHGIDVDGTGDAYITGYTDSGGFPMYGQPYQDHIRGGTDAFVAKLNPAGNSFVWSTFLGGSGDDFGHSIAVDDLGNSYVTGSTTSSDFPLVNAIAGIPGGSNAFAVKLDTAGHSLVWSTILGGSDDEFGYGVALDAFRSAFVVGTTYSNDFPTYHALQPSRRGGNDVFVAKLLDITPTPTATATPSATPTSSPTPTPTVVRNMIVTNVLVTSATSAPPRDR
jgi:hypothetical protein